VSDAIAVESRITRVRVFEDRAEVERRAELTLPRGVSWVEVGGVALTLDDLSLVASCEKGGRAVAARALRRVRQEPAANPSEVAAREAEEVAAGDKLRDAEAAHARATAELARLEEMTEALFAALEKPANGLAADDPRRRWLGAWQALDHARLQGDQALGAAEAAVTAANRELAFARARLAAARSEVPRFEAALRVQIEASGDGPVELKLVYRVGAALWRPHHVARLVGGELVWHRGATLWQRSGEDWRDVPCELSTARPAQDAQTPLVSDEVLALTKKQDRTVRVEARDESIQLAGLDRGTREVADMPGVDDGGEPLLFKPTRPIRVPSDGAPVRVDLGEAKLPCTVETVLMAERAEAAHVRATATWRGDAPLLAGPVHLGREGSLVGRSRVGFVGQGEPFELGFGADDGLRARRRVDEERDTSMLGTQKISREVHVYLSNLAATPRKILVVERVPKSEIADVKVEITAAGGATVDDKDGFLRWHIELPANQTKKLSFAYRIEAASKVSLSL
jgi:uncharacterized protein (TIGR02231 family)